jgi:predicted nucleotidyltransferase component of viral defense system
MVISDQYRRQVSLLVQILPFVAEEKCFALKGGTAINLFIRDLPRLSVDIDLAYLPVHDRRESLVEIDASLKRIAEKIRNGVPRIRVHTSELKGEGGINKLTVQTSNTQVKIEVTPVLRGCVYDPVELDVTAAVESEYGFARTQVVSFADLYAGKIVAALDRQHPRDLFDVRDLLANEGIDDELRTAFVIYLLSHGRPMHEVLNPSRRDLAQEYERGFDGMTTKPVSLQDLIETREQIIRTMTEDMPSDHKKLLVSFVSGDPDWSSFNIEGAQELPAVQWRGVNLNKLEKSRREELASQLSSVVGL